MNTRWGITLGVFLLGLIVSTAAGDDKKPAASATGTWESTFTNNEGQSIKTIYKLKQDGEKLTGTVTGRDGKDREIEKGQVKDGKVSFQVTRERDGQKFTIRFKGELKSDSIKGKVEVGEGDSTRDFDWEATRQKKDK